MSQTISMSSINNINFEDIRFNHVIKRNNGKLKRYIKYKQNDLIINGPKMILGSPITLSDDCYYIDLQFDNNSKNNQKTIKFIEGIDSLVVAHVLDTSKTWYQTSEDISLTQVEYEFIPTIKQSSIYENCKSLKFKIPIHQIEIYNQDHNVISPDVLNDKCDIIPLLRLDCVCKEADHIWVQWEIPQIKAEITIDSDPDSDIDEKIKGCQLIDVVSDDDSDSEIIPDTEF